MVAIAKERIMTWSGKSSWLLAIVAGGMVGISPAAEEKQETAPGITTGRLSPRGADVVIESTSRLPRGARTGDHPGWDLVVEPAPAAPAIQQNRYRTLLRVLEIPDDRKTYGDFCDFGYWAGTNYAGH